MAVLVPGARTRRHRPAVPGARTRRLAGEPHALPFSPLAQRAARTPRRGPAAARLAGEPNALPFRLLAQRAARTPRRPRRSPGAAPGRGRVDCARRANGAHRPTRRHRRGPRSRASRSGPPSEWVRVFRLGPATWPPTPACPVRRHRARHRGRFGSRAAGDPELAQSAAKRRVGGPYSSSPPCRHGRARATTSQPAATGRQGLPGRGHRQRRGGGNGRVGHACGGIPAAGPRLGGARG